MIANAATVARHFKDADTHDFRSRVICPLRVADGEQQRCNPLLAVLDVREAAVNREAGAVPSVKTARTATGVAIKRCPTCGQMLRGAPMQNGPRMVHPPGKGAVCRRIREGRKAK